MARRKNKPLDDPRATSERNREKNRRAKEYEIAEGYVLKEEDEASEITRKSLKRSRKFLIVSIIFLILCVALIFGYLFLYNQNIKNKQKNCWKYEQQIEEIAERYVTVNGFSSFPAYIDDVPGFDEVAQSCPSGGTYTWNPIEGEYSCSEHGHWPKGFNKEESIKIGTNTTNLNSGKNKSK